METVQSVALLGLKAIVTSAVIFNEVAIFSSPWISHPTCWIFSKAASRTLTLWTTLTYAVAEPLWSMIWLVLGRENAWILVLQLPPQSIWILAFTSALIQREYSKAQAAGTHPLHHKGNLDQQAQQPEPDRSSGGLFSALLIPLQVTAAMNAALALMSEHLYLATKQYESPILLGLSWTAIAVYLVIRFIEVTMLHRIHNAPSEATVWLHVCKQALPYALLCLAFKAFVRYQLSQPHPIAVILGFQKPAESAPWVMNGIEFLRNSMPMRWMDYAVAVVPKTVLQLVNTAACVTSGLLVGFYNDRRRIELFGHHNENNAPVPATLYRPYLDRYANPQGLGDGRPTATEIVNDHDAIGALKGKTILVTGGTGGLGLETAKVLALTGAKIFITARNDEKGQAAVDILAKSAVDAPAPEFLVMDLASLASVRAAAKGFIGRSTRLDILITNAGIIATPFGNTADGFDLHLGSNHFGHFLLFSLLQPLLSSSSTPKHPSRVIALSSGGHRWSNFRFDDMNFENGPYDPLKSYGQSKTANIWMCNYINRHFAPQIRGLSVHDGVILDTEIMRHFEKHTLEKLGDAAYFAQTACSVAQGVATTVFAALDPYYNARGGVYLVETGEARPAEEGDLANAPVYAPYAYDEDAEERLWQLSEKAVGLA